MGTALMTLGVMVALAVVAGLFYAWTAFRFRISYAPSAVHRVRTPDGHLLHLYRHRRSGHGARGRSPVLCLHGLGASHFNFDFPGTADLAGYLAEQGHDVYVASLRGDPDALPPDAPNRGHTFDDHVRGDLPALLDAVLALSGGTQVHLVGHSMGGLLCYALTAVHGEHGVASITALGSPVGFAEKGEVARELQYLGWLLKRLRQVRVRWLAQALAPFVGFVVGARFLRRQFNPDHVDLRYGRLAMWHALSHVSAPLLVQFADWIRHDEFRSVDGALDYRAALARLSVPLLVVAGAVDRLCRPDNALRALELAGSQDKQALVLGRECGCGEDYGHIDLIFGARAREEVFPRVASFLGRVDLQSQPQEATNVPRPPGPWVQ